MRSTGSEIRIHPHGRYLYSANRGHDTISAFQVDRRTGKLTFIEREPVRGDWPRNFNIDPSGKWLLAAGRRSNTIAVFQIDQDTGGLIYGKRVDLGFDDGQPLPTIYEWRDVYILTPAPPADKIRYVLPEWPQWQ